MRRIELIIFDCDGVLVDSELIANRVFAALLNELGLPVTLDLMFENFVGRSMQHCREHIGPRGALHLQHHGGPSRAAPRSVY